MTATRGTRSLPRSASAGPRTGCYQDALTAIARADPGEIPAGIRRARPVRPGISRVPFGKFCKQDLGHLDGPQPGSHDRVAFAWFSADARRADENVRAPIACHSLWLGQQGL